MKTVPAAIIASLLFYASSSFAYIYDEDVVTQEDIATWMEQAKNGDPEAEFNLGEAYLKGEGGLDKDEKEAAKWYQKSADQGYVDAEFAMGFVYRGGGGRPMNKVLSYMWFDIAAKSGDDRAFELRNDVGWSMTQPEIDEARKLSRRWHPGKSDEIYKDDAEFDSN